MTLLERVIGALVVRNNERIARADPAPRNPLSLDACEWHQRVAAQFPAIRADWDRFAASGGTLPRIEDLIVEDQGNEGPWRVGLLVTNGRPVEPLASAFPATTAALSAIPGLRSAMWSQLDAGTELSEHCGPNRGVLRYHLGVLCNDDTALQVGDTVVAYRDGEGVLFDDTERHAAWNRGSTARITLFCELRRPQRGVGLVLNRVTQAVLSLDPRYRRGAARAREWHHALNGD